MHESEWSEAARRVDETLVLAVAHEPLEALDTPVFGLDDAALRRVVALTLARVGIAQAIELSVLVTGDEGLRALNREYRGRDEATDVLSFQMLDTPLVAAPADQLWQSPDAFDADDDAEAPLDEHGRIHADGALPPVQANGHHPTAADVVYADDLLGDDESDDEDDDNDDSEIDATTDDDFAFLAPDAAALHLGDIALSRDAIARQAAQAGHSAAWELAYLLAHGVLHLVGYDDQTDEGYRAMVAHQEAILGHAAIAR